jgi:hypothetical protein
VTEQSVALRNRFEYLMRAFEVGGLHSLGPGGWARLTALFDRLGRAGVSSATEVEAAWVRDLEEQATYALARGLVAGPGRDRAIVRARLTDSYIRRRLGGESEP